MTIIDSALHTAFAFLLIAIGSHSFAQDGSLLTQPPSPAAQSVRLLTPEDSSLLYRKPEPPKELKLHDIVTVVVDIKSRSLSLGEHENRKVASLTAVLQDWIGFNEGTLQPDLQADGDPAISGDLQGRFRTEAEQATRNALTFTIAATVIDVRPNGNLVIEARQVAKENEDVWELSLTGMIRREDVTPDNKVKSENIAELNVHKREMGHVRDGYRRGWFQRWYDQWAPW